MIPVSLESPFQLEPKQIETGSHLGRYKTSKSLLNSASIKIGQFATDCSCIFAHIRTYEETFSFNQSILFASPVTNDRQIRTYLETFSFNQSILFAKPVTNDI